jgi:hypothetical protein
MSKLSSSSDFQIISSLLSDSLTIINQELLGSPLCQTREKEETIFMLSNEDRDCFLDTLKNPPKPNQKLKDAFNFYYDTKFKDE